MQAEDWFNKLEKLKEMRGQGRAFDDLHRRLSKEARVVDETFLMLVLLGDFELAHDYLVQLDQSREASDSN